MKSISLVAVALLLFVALQGTYVVSEWEQVVITRFGKPVGDPITTPGLKIKLPFVDDVKRFDRRFLEWSGEPEELPTKDKVFIWVDTYARWRVTDPLLFLQQLQDENRAQTRLDDFIDGEVRNTVARHVLLEVIRTSDREPVPDPSQRGASAEQLAGVSYGRERIREEILEKVAGRVDGLGIEVLDVQFRRINYSETVRPDVYNRMISERRRISDRFRSEGQGEASRILGEMGRDLKEIQSQAYREAQEIIGRADAEATQIFAEAYNASSDSRSFYEFLKTMETLRLTTDASTSLLLSTEGDFYRFLEDSSP